MTIPERPKVYHITHIDNLSRIIGAKRLWSDAKRIEKGLTCSEIGMSNIKNRRLNEIIVDCHPPTTVGQYTPFYFCPRSVMLYILHMGNHPDITYREGQTPIVHLMFDMQEVIEWAESKGKRWAFSDRNAAASIASFYDNLEDLGEINWNAVKSHDFAVSENKEGKQAEFLVEDYVPWNLVQKIGVFGTTQQQQVTEIIEESDHTPQVSVARGWYF